MSTQSLLQCLQELQGVLSPVMELSLASIVRFVFLATNLKNNIVLVQPGDYDPGSPPANLSPSITHFLSASCQIVLDDVPAFWTALKDTIWHKENFRLYNTLPLFTQYGQKYGISESSTCHPLEPVNFMVLQPCLLSTHHSRHVSLLAAPT